ncbi:MAG: imidazole glycerol phosphate synthase subunit HisH [Coriobacteriaceae bacterium]|jgi:glutamine amidotransferase|nr:imidazole glycerol phosphate synthase subunit HisH [Coriobacteriaceae bacterium]
MIAVVDYCKGNLKSVERGLRNVGGEAQITDDPCVIARARAIVLPGVGAFADAAATMVATGQMQVIRDRILAGVPFLGICLGLHLLFEEGEEGAPSPQAPSPQAPSAPAISPQAASAQAASAPAMKAAPLYPRGLGIVPGRVLRMPAFDATGAFYKVPHVGWNSLEFNLDTDGLAWNAGTFPLLNGISPGEHFYFTHSYIAPHTPATVATTTHAATFPSVIAWQDTCFGVQFHPEKSSDAGALVLRNFLDIVERA